MLDKMIPYHDIIMKASIQDSCIHTIVSLPDGYTYKMYEDGDELSWAKLEFSVDEFDSLENALAYFERVFKPYQKQLKERMCFILNSNKEIVATATAWFKSSDTKYYPVLHWVSTSPSHQGKGLGKAIVIYALSKFLTLDSNENEVFLHTQTWSYKAVALYVKLGFHISDIPLLDQTSDPLALPILKGVLDQSIYKQLFIKNI